LFLQELNKLKLTLPLFLALLLLSQLQLLVPYLPELCEFLFILFNASTFMLLAFDLQSSRAVNSLLHLELATLLLLVQTISFIFSLSNLLVKHLLLIILKSSKLLNLMVDHLLSQHELVLGPLVKGVSTHIVHLKLLSGELFNASFFSKLLLPH